MNCMKSVTVCPSAVSLTVGQWYYEAAATVCSDGDSCCDTCCGVTWHSDNTAVATVNPVTGTIYAKAVGTAKIYAVANDGSGASDYITVTVSSTVKVQSITFDKSYLYLNAGECYTLSPTVLPANATNKSLLWESLDPSIAYMRDGQVCGIAHGYTSVRATARDGSGVFCEITVEVNALTYVNDITVCPSSKTIRMGQSFYPDVTVCPANASNKNLFWHSSDSSVLTVNEHSGMVYAKSIGNATVTVTAQDRGFVSDCCSVTVIPPIYIECITLNKSSLSLYKGENHQLIATLCPSDATVKNLAWQSDNPCVADVTSSGLVRAHRSGTATIYATAKDGSGVFAECTATVISPVMGIELSDTSLTMEVNGTHTLTATVKPTDATNKAVIWSSSNTSVATVNQNGKVTAIAVGSATVTVKTADGSYTASAEIWVKGKTPVFLLHGRDSNSFDTWGAGNLIYVNPLNPEEKTNSHFDPNVNATSRSDTALAFVSYTAKPSQDITSYHLGSPITVNGVVDEHFEVQGIFNGEFKDGGYISTHSEGGNLAYYLKDNGYIPNVNLFVFNYPNQDAVIHSATKFKVYIENLINYVRTTGSDEMKHCFYPSAEAYQNNDYKINLIGHSMGGLVCRYYIENLNQDQHVTKLITICTPHWGSDLATWSNNLALFPILHQLCDHDLDPNSNMYGGSSPAQLNGCIASWANVCYAGQYILTPSLKYADTRVCKYYAIAGIDKEIPDINIKDVDFDVNTEIAKHGTYAELKAEIEYEINRKISANPSIDIFVVGDNVVGLLSQIGWSANTEEATPTKRIPLEALYIDVDPTGNHIFNRLHTKINHRLVVFNKIIEYLEE